MRTKHFLLLSTLTISLLAATFPLLAFESSHLDSALLIRQICQKNGGVDILEVASPDFRESKSNDGLGQNENYTDNAFNKHLGQNGRITIYAKPTKMFIYKRIATFSTPNEFHPRIGLSKMDRDRASDIALAKSYPFILACFRPDTH